MGSEDVQMVLVDSYCVINLRNVQEHFKPFSE